MSKSELDLLEMNCTPKLEVCEISNDQFSIQVLRKFIEEPYHHKAFNGNFKECKIYLEGFNDRAMFKKRDKSDKKRLKKGY